MVGDKLSTVQEQDCVISASRESFIKFVHKVLNNYLYVSRMAEISVAQSNQNATI